MSRWLVTGGAGYIGSHVIRALLAAGETPVVIDDLSTGVRSRIPAGVAFVHGDILDGDAILDAMTDIDGVIHLAGRKSVAESVDNPLAYYDTNVSGTLSILRAMRYRNVRRIILSSTASLYAERLSPIDEESTTLPLSPYAASKLMAERCILDFAKVYDCKAAVLRYFNVAGAAEPQLRDDSRDNLFPRLTRALRDGVTPEIFGDDYPTPDGTPVRDYVHVSDIADAHALVAVNIEQLRHNVYNIGTGHGTSVREIINACGSAIGQPITPILRPRRPGDAASTVANVSRIRNELGWRSRFGLMDIVDCMKE